MCALCGECCLKATDTKGQTTIGSGTQLDLLMMGIKCPKHVEIVLITNKSLFVASSWFLFYLLIKYARSFKHNVIIRAYCTLVTTNCLHLILSTTLSCMFIL